MTNKKRIALLLHEAEKPLTVNSVMYYFDCSNATAWRGLNQLLRVGRYKMVFDADKHMPHYYFPVGWSKMDVRLWWITHDESLGVYPKPRLVIIS
jgi:hypothetical protein